MNEVILKVIKLSCLETSIQKMCLKNIIDYIKIFFKPTMTIRH